MQEQRVGRYSWLVPIVTALGVATVVLGVPFMVLKNETVAIVWIQTAGPLLTVLALLYVLALWMLRALLRTPDDRQVEHRPLPGRVYVPKGYSEHGRKPEVVADAGYDVLDKDDIWFEPELDVWYSPDWKLAERSDPTARRASIDEIGCVRETPPVLGPPLEMVTFEPEPLEANGADGGQEPGGDGRRNGDRRRADRRNGDRRLNGDRRGDGSVGQPGDWLDSYLAGVVERFREAGPFRYH